MGGWVAWMCAMMLAVLLFVGRADVCVDGCRTGSCIDVGWVDVCSEAVLYLVDSFRRLRRGGGVDVCIEVAMGSGAGCPVLCNDVVRSDAVES